MIYRKLIFPLLSGIDPESVHDLSITWLERAQHSRVGRNALRILVGKLPQKEVEVFGLKFPNVLGIAAGFDKDVRVALGLACLGFGHIEVGTITPLPQIGNPKPRIFRLPEDKAIINRMGFPNCGAAMAAERMRMIHRHDRGFIIGASIGKQKETSLEEALGDYLKVMKAIYPYADYLAVNVSSPNTPELRRLQSSKYLDTLLRELVKETEYLAEKHAGIKKPILLKIAPDLSWDELNVIIDAALLNGVDGIIATNTTIDRQSLGNKYLHESGGLSGRPLGNRSNKIITYIRQQSNNQLPIIGVGGIFSAEDVQAKLDAGASLVQIYTGLVYEGPTLASRILKNLKE